MTSPDLSDDRQAEPPPSAKRPKWPWAQVGLLSANAGFFLMGLTHFVSLTGMTFPEGVQALSGLVFLGGLAVYFSSPKHRAGQASLGEAVPYSLAIHRLNLAIFGAALSMFLLSMLIPAIHQARRANQDHVQVQKPEGNPDAWQTVRSPKAPILVDLPAHWVVWTDPVAGGNDVARMDAANELLFFLQSVPKDDVTYAGLDAWAEATLDQLNGSLEESEVIERTAHQGQDLSEIELCLEATDEKARVTIFMRFLETPKYYLWARTVSRRSGFQTHGEILRRVVRSVRSE